MPRVLILCAHRPKRSPSQRYRFEQYLVFLEKHGFHFTYSYLLNKKDDTLFYAHGSFLTKAFILAKTLFIRLKDLFRFKNFDVVFIQREALFFGSSFFEKRAFHSGAKVIFDFDDSIWLADTSPGNQKWEWLKKPEKFYINCRNAHVVIAGNSYLAEKAKSNNANTFILPTTIDTEIHMPLHELRHKDVVTIGWSGSLSTVKHFEVLLPVLKKIKALYGSRIKIKLLGDKNYFQPELAVEAVAWTEETEVQELNSFDIGIMPLNDDAWAQGKCGLKGLSYMACEVPCIMSAVGVNKEIIQHQTNGLLATNEEEWFDCIKLLIENKELRLKLGKKGRETVIKEYSVESQKNNYLNVFTNA